jgi:plastocyanin
MRALQSGLSVVVLLILTVVLAGCATVSSAAPAPVETNRVELPPSYRFDPPVIHVPVGATVTWHNSDNFTHDVHLLGAINWHSDPLHPGDSVSYTFDKPGEYPYLCDFHSQDMKGKVIVGP